MSIRSVDEWRKIMTDLAPNEAANKIVAELDPAARTVYNRQCPGSLCGCQWQTDGRDP